MDDKELKYCEFCGHLACFRCIHKKHSFAEKPGQLTGADVGLCCRICDRKFIHNNIIKEDIEAATFLHNWDYRDQEHALLDAQVKTELANIGLNDLKLKKKKKVRGCMKGKNRLKESS